MSPTNVVIPEADPSTTADRTRTLLVIYSLTGGVAWWAAHLIVSAVLVQAVCNALVPRWVMTANNVVCALGVATALVASLRTERTPSEAAAATGRAHFLGYVAVVFNLAALFVVVLESIPIYLLGTCS